MSRVQSLKFQSINTAILLASVIGAFIEFIHNSKKPFRDRILNFIIGVAIAYFVAPVIWDWLNISDENTNSGIAFICGTLGTNLLDWSKRVFNVFQNKSEEIVDKIIK